MLRRLIILLFTTLLSLGAAQSLEIEAILDHMRTRAESLEDASFLLIGQLIDTDGGRIPLEIEIELIPGVPAGRAYILRPDALADNFIVLDGDTVYNYLFVTNQVTVFDATDPDALGSLLPPDSSGESFDFTFNLEEIFAGWGVAVESYLETPAGNAYALRFENPQPEFSVEHVDALVLDGSWMPYILTFYQPDGSVIAELAFEEYVLDQGLALADLTYIPEDAEIIDER
jgi:outer membrane lipoprotein-sorting protein